MELAALEPDATVRTGRAAFDSVFGESVFDYLGKHPDESAVFNEGMSGFSSNIAPAVAEAYNFAAFQTIVDVGGGHGVLLNTILQAYPEVNGIVFDSPHVVAGAEDAIREAGLTGRCRAVGGDFFRGVPDGGDAYLMKHIIHDWSDDRATTILRNCRRAMYQGAKLLLIERIVPERLEPSPAHKAIARGDGPASAILALGYAGWAPGQLETEIQGNGWLHCAADPELIFGPDTGRKYDKALRKLGIDLGMLSSEAGHA